MEQLIETKKWVCSFMENVIIGGGIIGMTLANYLDTT